MESSLFRPGQAVACCRRSPRPILKPKPLNGIEVYLGASNKARSLMMVHWCDLKRTSYLCIGSGCDFCKLGWVPMQRLYLGVRQATNGHDAVACVSADVASEWLKKSPDFCCRFRIEKGSGIWRGTRCVQIETHGRLKAEWEGFDVHEEMIAQFAHKAARRSS